MGLARLLQSEGYCMRWASNGKEGLRKTREYSPDLIISDVWMPEMNGFDFCRTIKDDEALAYTPIVLLTSLSSPRDIASGLNSGADYYLTKPYSPSLLVSMVADILAEQKAAPGGHVTESLEMRLGKDLHTVISTDIRQIANFLFSTYESLVDRNQQLTETKGNLKSLNDNLETKVRMKTLSLKREARERTKAAEALQRTLSQTVAALARTVEMRDPYTAGHQMRVAQLAVAVAQRLGLSEDQVQGIRVMGMLHDIGKIVVPAEILTKPNELKPYEFLLIKAHSQAGYDILKDIDFPWPVADAVLHHHERLDGSGYPQQLSGDDITMEARIIAVADVMESMSSDRPYRPALGLQAAIHEVTTNKDVLYDGQVVEALLDVAADRNGCSEAEEPLSL